MLFLVCWRRPSRKLLRLLRGFTGRMWLRSGRIFVSCDGEWRGRVLETGLGGNASHADITLTAKEDIPRAQACRLCPRSMLSQSCRDAVVANKVGNISIL